MTHPEFSGNYKLENDLYIYQYSGLLTTFYNHIILNNKDLFGNLVRIIQKDYHLLHIFHKGANISIAPGKELELVYIYDDHFGTIFINKTDIPSLLGYQDWKIDCEL